MRNWDGGNMVVTIFIGNEEVKKEDLEKYTLHSDVLDRILSEKIANKEEKNVS